jgi:hypothetical protein
MVKIRLNPNCGHLTLADCETVELKNSQYQTTRNGVYKVLPKSMWCTPERPSFQQKSTNDNYLFYLDTGDGWRGWMAGSTLCQNLGGIAASGTAMAPEEVPRGQWEEVFRGEWHYSKNMVAACLGECSHDASLPYLCLETIMGNCVWLLHAVIYIVRHAP